jgi:hypothetical protein
LRQENVPGRPTRHRARLVHIHPPDSPASPQRLVQQRNGRSESSLGDGDVAATVLMPGLLMPLLLLRQTDATASAAPQQP